MQAMQSEVYHAGIALDLIDMDLATPRNGRLDKEKIDDAIWLGVYSGPVSYTHLTLPTTSRV